MEELWDMHKKTSQKLEAWEKKYICHVQGRLQLDGQRTSSASRCAELRTLYLEKIV